MTLPKPVRYVPTPGLPSYTSVGSYPLLYLTPKDDCLCASCADDEEEEVVGHVHWEGSPIHCDECSAEIESAYGDPEADEEE